MWPIQVQYLLQSPGSQVFTNYSQTTGLTGQTQLAEHNGFDIQIIPLIKVIIAYYTHNWPTIDTYRVLFLFDGQTQI